MINFPPTVVLRHRKENVKKCSLRGLENRDDFIFYSYPTSVLPELNGYILLTMDGPPLTEQDQHLGLFILDATWRYAAQMERSLDLDKALPRSIPAQFRTAYPRYQTACPNPERGLASLEAIYVAYTILKRDISDLFTNYHWGADFLQLNEAHFQSLT
jgi:pre-rRNA-processing protein TSR3